MAGQSCLVLLADVWHAIVLRRIPSPEQRGDPACLLEKERPIFRNFLFPAHRIAADQGDVGFHATGYSLVSFFSVAYLASEIYDHISRNSGRSWKKTGILPTIYVSVYSGLALLFLATVLLAHFSNGSGMLLSDADPSPYPYIVKAITAPDEPIWVMPINPAVYLSSERMPAFEVYVLPSMACSVRRDK